MNPNIEKWNFIHSAYYAAPVPIKHMASGNCQANINHHWTVSAQLWPDDLCHMRNIKARNEAQKRHSQSMIFRDLIFTQD